MKQSNFKGKHHNQVYKDEYREQQIKNEINCSFLRLGCNDLIWEQK